MSFSSLWKKLLDLPNDRPAKALWVATLVGFTCALTVSTTAVLLQPKRQANIEALRQLRLDTMLATLPGLEEVLVESGADSLQTILIDLNTGTIADPDKTRAAHTSKASLNDNTYLALDKKDDIAGIEKRPNQVQAHLLEKQGQLYLLVLPIYGKGYQSTIRAWLTLSGDLDTVVALSISDQGETPGIGARIMEPEWQRLWSQKKLHNDNGAVALSVVTGKAIGLNQVDGISGATRTGLGINSMMQFWLGDLGFALFLDNLRKGKLQVRMG